MRTLYFYFTMIAALLFMACGETNDVEEMSEQKQPESSRIHFVAELGSKSVNINHAKPMDVGFDVDGEYGKEDCINGRRVIKTPDEGDNVLDAEWVEGEKIALIYGGLVHEATISKVTSTGSATVEADLTDSPADGQSVKIVYPFSAADAGTENGIKENHLKRGQDGTLNAISSKYDVAVADGNLVVNGATGSLREIVKLENLYAICRFRFTCVGNRLTGINVLVIRDNGTNSTLYVVSGSEPDGSIYVAMDPEITGVKDFMVFTTEANYSGSAVPSLQASMFYRPTLSLTQGNGGGAVDLGLSDGTIWATCNVGASVPEEYGDYFAWGDPEPYYSSLDPMTWKEGKSDGYVWSSYRWCNGTEHSMTKYCNNSEYGLVDNKTVLEAADDAATVNWGSMWKMPTTQQFRMLRLGVVTEWGTLNGVNGRFFYKKDASGNKVVDKYIFLPAAGQYGDGDINELFLGGSKGNYWGCQLYDIYSAFGGEMTITSSSMLPSNMSRRMFGKSVRAVLAL